MVVSLYEWDMMKKVFVLFIIYIEQYPKIQII
jgi:hypothetical protein